MKKQKAKSPKTLLKMQNDFLELLDECNAQTSRYGRFGSNTYFYREDGAVLLITRLSDNNLIFEFPDKIYQLPLSALDVGGAKYSGGADDYRRL